MRALCGKRLHETIANILQVAFSSGRIEVIEHVTLGPDCGTLDLHAGATGGEENDFARRRKIIGEPNRPVVNVGQFAHTAVNNRLSLRLSQEYRQ